MIERLYIKNIALISELSIEFSDGLNILSGETGAGKSIIIDSINFVLGEKSTRGLIKSGESSAEVSAIISVNDENTRSELSQMSVDTDDDGNIMLYRHLSSAGKNVYKINNKPVTGGILKEVSSLLVDIHGQHEHQSLLDSKKHIHLLDRFCGAEMTEIKDKLATHALNYKNIVSAIKELNFPKDKTTEELYEFQINEIRSAKLSSDEEKLLDEKKKKIDNAVRLKKISSEALGLLSKNDSSNVRDMLSDILSKLEILSDADPKMAECAKTLELIKIQTDDLSTEVKAFADSVDFSEEEAAQTEERLEIIYSLKRKYGGDIPEILRYLAETEKKLDKMRTAADKLHKLTKDRIAEEKEIAALCEKLTKLRKKAAENTEKKTENLLHELGMENARFRIDIEKKNSFSVNGWDKVEFMFSANFNQPPMPLSKIASGGEMSRVMLSLKNVLAEADSIDTFVFDEIDTGVSGRAAQQVAEKLAMLGRSHQILCITHLPQIAAMGDSNYLIEKETHSDKTQSTDLKRLGSDQVYKEIARLIGGAEITENTMTAAREMKELADKTKREKIL